MLVLVLTVQNRTRSGGFWAFLFDAKRSILAVFIPGCLALYNVKPWKRLKQ